MKKYTFTVPKTTSNDTTYYTVKYNKKSDSDTLKSYLIDNAIEKYPWLGGYSNKTITIKPTTYTFTAPKYTYTEFYDKYSYTSLYDLLNGYGKQYNSSDYVDEYDFKVNGVPVRIMSDRIQIGYHMIAKDNFNYLSDGIKKNIYNIYININN